MLHPQHFKSWYVRLNANRTSESVAKIVKYGGYTIAALLLMAATVGLSPTVYKLIREIKGLLP